MGIPKWLPPMVDTNFGSEKEWERLIDLLYHIFEWDFIQHHCLFEKHRVIFNDRKIDSPYEEGFWHLVSRDDKRVRDRFFDSERAKRLPWCKPAIENTTQEGVRAWDYLEENKRTNTYIWLVDSDYLVILQRRKKVSFLVTAYWVDGDASRRLLQRKYEKRAI